MELIGIQANNHFTYLGNNYNSPFFLVNYVEYPDLNFISVNNFMYTDYNAYTNGNNYLHSFATSLEFESATDIDFILNFIIEFLLTISPNTEFNKLKIEV